MLQRVSMPQSDASQLWLLASATSIAAQSAPSSRAASQMRISSPLLPSAAPHLLPRSLPHLPICPVCPICRALAAPLQSRLSQAQPIEVPRSLCHLPHTSMYLDTAAVQSPPSLHRCDARPSVPAPLPSEVPDTRLRAARYLLPDLLLVSRNPPPKIVCPPWQ